MNTKMLFALASLLTSMVPSHAMATPNYFLCSIKIEDVRRRFQLVIDTAAQSGSAHEIRTDARKPMVSVGQPTFYPDQVSFVMSDINVDMPGSAIIVGINRNNLLFYMSLLFAGQLSKPQVGACVKTRAPQRQF